MTSTRISQLFTFVTLVLIIAAGVVQAQTFSVLYNFGSNSGDPSKPAYSGIIAQGRDGNLYVASSGLKSILRYDGTTGAFIDTFVTPDPVARRTG